VDRGYCSRAMVRRVNSVIGTVASPGGHMIKV
jgi:hypothetical protein